MSMRCQFGHKHTHTPGTYFSRWRRRERFLHRHLRCQFHVFQIDHLFLRVIRVDFRIVQNACDVSYAGMQTKLLIIENGNEAS